jgi:hypothetical protein
VLHSYLTGLANDISLGQATYFNKISERAAFAGSLCYFGLDIELRQTSDPTEDVRIVSPNEFALDGSHSLKPSETFSMAVAGRYIRSNLKVGTDTGDATANTFAIDIAGFTNQKKLPITTLMVDGGWF